MKIFLVLEIKWSREDLVDVKLYLLVNSVGCYKIVWLLKFIRENGENDRKVIGIVKRLRKVYLKLKRKQKREDKVVVIKESRHDFKQSTIT